MGKTSKTQVKGNVEESTAPKAPKKGPKPIKKTLKAKKQEKTKWDPSRKSPFFNVKNFQKRHSKDLKDSGDNSSDLLHTFEKKIEGAKFRMLNETLYTTSGDQAKEMFEKDPSLFGLYHRGYESSVKAWPENPLDIIIKWLTKKSNTLIVGDFGCGEAKLQESVKQKVHSFDLVAQNSKVTACDIAQTPLKDGSLDIAVYCLSLMGTNWMDYLKEANRVLKVGGILKIAEVESRFVKVLKFQDLLEKMGFIFRSKQAGNGYFIIFEYAKKENRNRVPNVEPDSVLKPCLYKKR